MMAKLPASTASRCMAADEAAAVADVWLEAQSYVSMNRFHGPRRVDRLAELNALYVDLDVYRKPYLNVPRHEVVSLARLHLAAIGLPDPSYIIDSGRGLYILYLIDPCPARALPRWTEAERFLVALLEPFGSDAACADAARVLRIPGTTNPKAGAIVSVVDGVGMRYGFDGLADAISAPRGVPRGGCGNASPSSLRQGRRGVSILGTALRQCCVTSNPFASPGAARSPRAFATSGSTSPRRRSRLP